MRKASAEKAPAKAAPAKASAKPAPEKKARDSAPKIKWSYNGERGKSNQTGTASNGAVYRIDADGEKSRASVTPEGGELETLAEGVSIGAAYAKCTAHAKAQAEKAAA